MRLLFVVLSVSVFASCQADMIVLQPGAAVGKDLFVTRGGTGTEFRANNNHGAQDVMVVGQTGASGQYERSLVEFTELQTAVSGNVQSARLGLTVVGGHSGLTSIPVEIYRLKQSWVEGTLIGTSPADGATWQTFDGTNAWPGSSGFRSLDSGAFSLASAEIDAPIAVGTLNRNLSLAGTLNWFDLDVGKVQEWVDGGFANNGFLIRSTIETSGLSQLHIATSDHATSGFHPILELDMASVPEPGALGGMILFAVVGLAVQVRRRGRVFGKRRDV
jgi:hypothetical protein